ncbi:MAG: hypothetical protein ACFE88_15970 [Candidatus Hermodarchaeota archaeon]
MSKYISKKFDFKSDLTPICPGCEKEINIEDFMEQGRGTHQKVGKYSLGLKTVMFTVTVFFCPNCRKVLGVSKAA